MSLGITSLITDNCCTQRVPVLGIRGPGFTRKNLSARSPCGEFCIPLGPEAKAIQAVRALAAAGVLEGCAGVKPDVQAHPEGSCIKLNKTKKIQPPQSFSIKAEEVTGENYAFQWQAVSGNSV